MSNSRLTRFPARNASRGGFTLVELLVVIGIIAILAGVALGPITHGLETAKESAGMQTSRTIALSDFQYQTDNGAYASGATSMDVAAELVLGGYITDPSIFAKDKASAYNGTTANIASMPAASICWDFMSSSTAAVAPAKGNAGLGTSDPDGMPLVFSTGQTIVIPAQGPGATITLGANCPYGNNGMAVCFKSNSATFLKGTNTGGAATVNDKTANYLFSPSFSCTPASYAQLKP